jgi:phosphoglycerol transferase MdoB-like AlkP superfamily enzyme
MRTVLYFLKATLVWLLFFAIAKWFFFTINSEAISMSDFFAIWKNGLRLDLAMVGYVMIAPLLLSLLASLVKRSAKRVITGYWWTLFVVMVLIVAVDPFFFSYWGQKTNLGFTQFLGKENAGLASIELKTYIIVIGFMAVAIYWFVKWGVHQLRIDFKINMLMSLLLIGVSVVLLRGGISIVPINVSSAYFSENNVHNNTAVNAVWNFMATELERDKHAALMFFEDEQELARFTLPVNNSESLDSLVQVNDSTNVLLLVLESFSAKVVGALSGPKYDATPNLNVLMKEGINYHSAYASSFRSDKGLLALTYGVPSSARQTLTNFPQHLADRASIFSVFPSSYTTRFAYGGNLEFANIKVLFKDADEVISQSGYASDNKNAWGVHDEDVFQTETKRFLENNSPQFTMLFSLSSHEPFDVPNFSKHENAYLNSVAYTDSCLGAMVDQLKRSDKWANTLLIITADHGTIRPDNPPLYDTSNFRIPLLLIGGAVIADTSIATVVSQMDIFPTVAQLFSNSELAKSSLLHPQGRAFYSYHDGLVYLSDSTLNMWDIGTKTYVRPPQDKPYEKVFFQVGNADFFSTP